VYKTNTTGSFEAICSKRFSSDFRKLNDEQLSRFGPNCCRNNEDSVMMIDSGSEEDEEDEEDDDDDDEGSDEYEPGMLAVGMSN
jgi:hypothetical protein